MKLQKNNRPPGSSAGPHPRRSIIFHNQRLSPLLLIVAFLAAAALSSCAGENDEFDGPRGSLLIAGGAVQSDNQALFSRFIELAGGSVHAKIAIFPTASGNPAQSASYYRGIFARYGVPPQRIVVIPIADRDDAQTTQVDESYWRLGGISDRDQVLEFLAGELAKTRGLAGASGSSGSGDDCSDEAGDDIRRRLMNDARDLKRDQGVMGADEIIRELKGVTGIWFTGGWQGRIRDLLMDQDEEGNWYDGPVLEEIRRLYHDGAVIGGTSAGAAIMSDPMIDGGSSLGALLQGATEEDPYYDDRDDRVFLTRGLGFWSEVMADQHFIERGRFGRLIAAMADRNINLGIGVDENTALVVRGGEVEVVGESGAIIIDMSAARIEQLAPMKASGIKLSYIEEKDRFDYLNYQYYFADYKDSTLRGDEFYSLRPPVNGNVFAPQALRYHMIDDLVDNQTSENFGFAFDDRDLLSGVEPGDGVMLRFYKGQDTNGFWGRKIFSGRAHFSVYHVYLDIEPTNVNLPGAAAAEDESEGASE
jgi:cyanophycinase